MYPYKYTPNCATLIRNDKYPVTQYSHLYVTDIVISMIKLFKNE